MNTLMFWFKHANTRKHVSEQSWSSGWNIFIILAHLNHLAQFYFSLIFSAINTFNCFWFDLTNKKKFSDWRQKHGEKWRMFTTFFLTATAAITGIISCKIEKFFCFVSILRLSTHSACYYIKLSPLLLIQNAISITRGIGW